MTERTRIKIEFDQEYVLRMPASEAMMSVGKHGHLQRLKIERCEDYQGQVFARVWFYDPDRYSGQTEEIGWIKAPYTDSEVGLYRDGDEWYAYLPDMSETPEAIQETVEKFRQDLDVILTNAGAVRIDIGPKW